MLEIIAQGIGILVVSAITYLSQNFFEKLNKGKDTKEANENFMLIVKERVKTDKVIDVVSLNQLYKASAASFDVKEKDMDSMKKLILKVINEIHRNVFVSSYMRDRYIKTLEDTIKNLTAESNKKEKDFIYPLIYFVVFLITWILGVIIANTQTTEESPYLTFFVFLSFGLILGSSIGMVHTFAKALLQIKKRLEKMD